MHEKGQLHSEAFPKGPNSHHSTKHWSSESQLREGSTELWFRKIGIIWGTWWRDDSFCTHRIFFASLSFQVPGQPPETRATNYSGMDHINSAMEDLGRRLGMRPSFGGLFSSLHGLVLCRPEMLVAFDDMGLNTVYFGSSLNLVDTEMLDPTPPYIGVDSG